MKTYKFSNITTVMLLVFLCCSCDDFLEQVPQSALSPEKYLTDVTHLETYVNGLYTSILNPSVTTLLIDVATDNQTAINASTRYRPGEWRTSEADATWWGFGNIYHCNYFLKQVLPRYETGSITGATNNINHYIGEIYFLRAYEYFKRYQALGDFPIVTEPLTDVMEELIEASKRSPRNEVARFILSDLDKAIELMDISIESRKTRINKRTALLLKSRVALFEGTFLKYFKGTAFVPNGSGWPGAGKNYNAGYAFPSGSIDAEIDFFLDQAIDASQKVADMVMLTANEGYVQQDVNEAGNPYMDMYASLDLSSYNEVLLWREYNRAMGIVHNAVIAANKANMSTGVTRGMVESFLMDNGLPIYAAGSGYKGDDYIADVRTGRDNRLVLFLKEPEQINILYEDAIMSGTWNVEPNPNIFASAAASGAGYSDTGTDITPTGYTLRKGGSYYMSQQGYANGYTGVIIFRGVEAMLNYIEAWYEKNGSLNAIAQQYWQAIRERAKVDWDINKTIAATDISKEAPNDWGAYSAGQLLTDPTLYNIRRERRCELMGEGFREMDLRRWRAMDQMIATPYHIEGIKIWGPMQDWYTNASGSTLRYGLDNTSSNVSPPDRSDYLRPYEKFSANNLYLDGYRWHMAHYLYPIPIKQILITSIDNDLSTSPVYQNPGWPMEAGGGPIN